MLKEVILYLVNVLVMFSALILGDLNENKQPEYYQHFILALIASLITSIAFYIFEKKLFSGEISISLGNHVIISTHFEKGVLINKSLNTIENKLMDRSTKIAFQYLAILVPFLGYYLTRNFKKENP